MDGVHDLGGVQGFGPVDPAADEPLAQRGWRGRMFGIEMSYSQPGGFNLDWMRHVMECMPPAAYLTSEYFDRWYWRDAGMLLYAGWVSIDELSSGVSSGGPIGSTAPLQPGDISAMLREGVDSQRPALGEPAFRPGDRVRATLQASSGATRLPRYVRGHLGTVMASRGWHVFADAHAHGTEKAEPLYNVGFRAGELWNDAACPKDIVFLDMWESYLEPVEA